MLDGIALPLTEVDLARLDVVSASAATLLARFLETGVAGGVTSSMLSTAAEELTPLPSSWEASVLTSALALETDFFGVSVIRISSASAFSCFAAAVLRGVFGTGFPSASSLDFGVAVLRGVFGSGLPSTSSFRAAPPRFLSGVIEAAKSS